MRNFMKLPLIIFGILAGIYSCDNMKNIDSGVDIFNFKTPIVQDILETDKVERNSVWLQFGNYNPIYIGPNKDSIYVSDRPNLEKYYIYYDYGKLYNSPDTAGILLLIDTTKIISENSMIWEEYGNMLSSKVLILKAFPVFVVNITKDTLDIGYGDHLPIVTEALDNKGTWRPIEEPYMYACGTGLNRILLPPNEIVVTSIPINKGKFKTKLRLRYGNILSREFFGTINPTQFESEWDENGERKPAPEG